MDVIGIPFIENPNTDVLMEMNFNRNRLQDLSFLENSIKKGLKIKWLILSENELGKQFEGNKSDDIFRNFHHLEVLDLRSNEIKTIKQNAFASQLNCTVLYLNKNYLLLINFDFSHMHKLLVMDLSNNLLTQLTGETRRRFEILKSRSKQFRLSLKGNPIECSCGSIDLIHWMQDHRYMIKDFNGHTCLYNNTIASFSNIESILADLDFRCSMNLALKISASLLASIFVATLFAIFLYRHRWEVRFFCVKFAANRMNYDEQEESGKQYKYDAFVAYHRSDVDWVRDQLYENLDQKDDETANPDRFQLCIHDRDFLPGRPIEDNIVRAIENSRKTILVLSENFLTSHWCELEMQIARMESFDRGKKSRDCHNAGKTSTGTNF